MVRPSSYLLIKARSQILSIYPNTKWIKLEEELRQVLNGSTELLNLYLQAAVYSIMMAVDGEFGKFAAKKYTRDSAAEIWLCSVKHTNIASYL